MRVNDRKLSIKQILLVKDVLVFTINRLGRSTGICIVHEVNKNNECLSTFIYDFEMFNISLCEDLVIVVNHNNNPKRV